MELMTKLSDKAEVFIDTLQGILLNSIGVETEFTLETNSDGSLNIENHKPGLPLVKKHHDPVLFLHVLYVVGLDSYNEHLKVKSSPIRLQAKVKED